MVSIISIRFNIIVQINSNNKSGLDKSLTKDTIFLWNLNLNIGENIQITHELHCCLSSIVLVVKIYDSFQQNLSKHFKFFGYFFIDFKLKFLSPCAFFNRRDFMNAKAFFAIAYSTLTSITAEQTQITQRQLWKKRWLSFRLNLCEEK